MVDPFFAQTHLQYIATWLYSDVGHNKVFLRLIELHTTETFSYVWGELQ